MKHKNVLKIKIHDPRSKIQEGGFTLVEMLVVISIMALLSSFLILYSRTGENQVILFREQSRLITALNRAKSLSIQLYNTSETEMPCAFGVHFSQVDNSFLIFRDLASDCQNASHSYNDPGELFENYQLSPKIKFGDSPLTDVTDIVFIPPDPKTLIYNNSTEIDDATITFETLDGNASVKVKVNNAGQITTQ